MRGGVRDQGADKAEQLSISPAAGGGRLRQVRESVRGAALSCVMPTVQSAKKRAVSDSVVRTALWATICLAAEQLAHSCAVCLRSPNGGQAQGIAGRSLPSVPTWRLVEALSLLGILLRAESVRARDVVLFASIGPVEFVEDGEPRFLWVQKGLEGEYSALGGRPDLLVTFTGELPTARNIDRIVEVKFVRSLGASNIRAEFGKAYDLRVRSYFIWTYYTPRPDVVAGARGLRLDVEELGFDTDRGLELLEQPAALLSKVAHALEESRKAQRFAGGVERANDEIRQKRLGPAE